MRAVKLFADGALGSRGAALHEDYADDPGNRGLFLTAPAPCGEKVRAVAQAGFQPAVHAIGDRGISETIAAIEGCGIAPPCVRCARGSSTSRSSAISEAPRIAAAGIVASMQPLRTPRATRRGSPRGWAPARRASRGAYAWRSVVRAGVPLAFGSDFPIESPDVRLGLFAAETRLASGASAPFLPDERLGARRGAARVHVGRGVRGVRGGAARGDPRGVRRGSHRVRGRPARGAGERAASPRGDAHDRRRAARARAVARPRAHLGVA